MYTFLAFEDLNPRSSCQRFSRAVEPGGIEIMLSLYLSLILALGASAAFAAGYDFSSCRNVLQQLERSYVVNPDEELYFDPHFYPEFGARQTRLAYIRMYETIVVQRVSERLAELLERTVDDAKLDLVLFRKGKREDLRTKFQKDLAMTDDLELRQILEEILHAIDSQQTSKADMQTLFLVSAFKQNVDLLDLGNKIRNIKRGEFTRADQEKANRVLATTEKAPRPVESKFDKPEPELLFGTLDWIPLSEIVPTKELTSGKVFSDALEITQLADTIFILSQIRLRTFERWVTEVPMEATFYSHPMREREEIQREELYSVFEHFPDRFPTSGEPAYLITALAKAEDVKLRAAKLLDSGELTPFLADDLKRHLRFLNELDLPPDSVFESYVAKLESLVAD